MSGVTVISGGEAMSGGVLMSSIGLMSGLPRSGRLGMSGVLLLGFELLFEATSFTQRSTIGLYRSPSAHVVALF